MVYTSLSIGNQGEKMRSFSEYRKQCIQETLNKLTTRSQSQAMFEMLRQDLLEHIELPELLTENVVAKSDFNRFRKAFKEHNRHCVNEICEIAKLTFYNHIIEEADAIAATSVDPVMAFKRLRDELSAEIPAKVKELQDIVVQAMGSPMQSMEEPEEELLDEPQMGTPHDAPSSGGQPGAAPTGGPSPTPTASPTSAPDPAAAPTGQPSGGRGFFPKDGWLRGLGRVIGRPLRDAGKYIQKNWYGENRKLIEAMFQEQQQDIDQVFQTFTTSLQKFINDKALEIAQQSGYDTSALGQVGQNQSTVAPPGTGNTQSLAGQDTRVMGQGDDAGRGTDVGKGTGTDVNALLGKNKAVNKALAAKEPNAIRANNERLDNVRLAAKKLGLHIPIDGHWGRGEIPKLHLSKINFGNAEDHKPASEKTFGLYRGKSGDPRIDPATGKQIEAPIGTGRGGNTNMIRELIFILAKDLQYPADSRDFMTHKLIYPAIKNFVFAKIGLDDKEYSGLDAEGKIAALLINYGNMLHGQGAATQPAGTVDQATTQLGDQTSTGTTDTAQTSNPADTRVMDDQSGQSQQPNKQQQLIDHIYNTAKQQLPQYPPEPQKLLSSQSEDWWKNLIASVVNSTDPNQLESIAGDMKSKEFHDFFNNVVNKRIAEAYQELKAANASAETQTAGADTGDPASQLAGAGTDTGMGDPVDPNAAGTDTGMGDPVDPNAAGRPTDQSKSSPEVAKAQSMIKDFFTRDADSITHKDEKNFANHLAGIWLDLAIDAGVPDVDNQAQAYVDSIVGSEDLTEPVKALMQAIQDLASKKGLPESFSHKIKRYTELLKEDKTPVSTAQKLRERLGLS